MHSSKCPSSSFISGGRITYTDPCCLPHYIPLDASFSLRSVLLASEAALVPVFEPDAIYKRITRRAKRCWPKFVRTDYRHTSVIAINEQFTLRKGNFVTQNNFDELIYA